MPLSPEQWHARYARQSGWTQQLRDYLLERSAIRTAKLVLDCGCGTGALEAAPAGLFAGFDGRVVGLDIAFQNLAYAKFIGAPANWVQGDTLRLPFTDGTFDIVFCHFLLLWVADPLQALSEMQRVTCPKGSVIVMAEPDYGGRVDFPPELEVLGIWQQASLRSQGAHPQNGRRLGWLLHQAGLQDIESGVLGAQWHSTPNRDEIESEWVVLHSDLESLLGTEAGTPWRADFEKLKRLDKTAWESGERVLYVPTFYAIGKKSGKILDRAKPP
jgi:SAM-dependent methyltransferase